MAISGTDAFIAENGAGDRLLALTEGFQSAFLACVVLAVVGLVISLALLGAPRRAGVEQIEAVPEPARE